ncbi:MAG: DUF177 domain-containing protein [Deltaproteobacteria bacterium]|nr:DUF177 domain-containing protein [Deltaproteobacteria bacterium]
MFIKVEEIGPDGLELDEPLPAAEISDGLGDGAVFRPIGDGRASIRAELVGRDVLVRGTVSAKMGAECSRCLSALTERFEVPFTVLFAKRAPEAGAKTEKEGTQGGEDQEGENLFFEGPVVELDGVVRDNLLLSLPMAPTCTPDCRGLCPSCGKNLNGGPCGCPSKRVESPLAAALRAKVSSTAPTVLKGVERGTPKTKKVARPPR